MIKASVDIVTKTAPASSSLLVRNRVMMTKINPAIRVLSSSLILVDPMGIVQS